MLNLNNLRGDYAWELIRRSDTVTLTTAREVEAIMARAFAGEFDADILQPTLAEHKERLERCSK